MKSPWLLAFVGLLVVGFGSYALYLGHNSVVIGAVFLILGGIAGIPLGQLWKSKETTP